MQSLRIECVFTAIDPCLCRTRQIKSTWLRHGTNWLLGDMALFFIPAILVVVQYPDLIRNEGLRILAVICMSTVLVMAVTAVAVDQVYRLELKLARRRQRTCHA